MWVGDYKCDFCNTQKYHSTGYAKTHKCDTCFHEKMKCRCFSKKHYATCISKRRKYKNCEELLLKFNTQSKWIIIKW